jgi:alcohol dehydrogenase
MPRNWQYYNPVRVHFAPGAIAHLADYIDFKRILLVTTPGFTRRGVVEQIRQSLGDRIIKVQDTVKPNPDVLDIDAQAASLRDLNPDCILALGCGSSMDTAKALARLLTQSKDATLATHFRDHRPLSPTPALPVVAIPTTAGTGSEVTPFGTVWDFEREKKYSITGDDLYAAIAVLDPELTIGVPHEVTISSGLDAISHALESTWNKNANAVTLGLATKSLQLSLTALPQLKEQSADIVWRSEMMQGSLMAGLAISQTRTALAHSISYPLTAQYHLPHGVACSFTLPALLSFNRTADDNGRLDALSRALGYEHTRTFTQALRGLLRELSVGELLLQYAGHFDNIRKVKSEMVNPARARNNLRKADMNDVGKIIEESLDSFSHQTSRR